MRLVCVRVRVCVCVCVCVCVSADLDQARRAQQQVARLHVPVCVCARGSRVCLCVRARVDVCARGRTGVRLPSIVPLPAYDSRQHKLSRKSVRACVRLRVCVHAPFVCACRSRP